MKKTTAVLSTIGAMAVGAVAAVFGIKALVKKETGKSLDDILTANETTEPEEVTGEAVSEDVSKIIAAVEAAAEVTIATGETAAQESPAPEAAEEIKAASEACETAETPAETEI